MLLFLWLAQLRERWFGKLKQRSGKRPVRAARRRPSRRLQVEALEDRIVPSGGTPSLTGTWSQLPLPPGGPVGTMFLLPNGDVMAQGFGAVNTWANWFQLQPNTSGSYVNGTWSQLASMSEQRLYFGSAVLPNDKVFVVGGEYSGPLGAQNETNTGEIYDIAANSWSPIPNFPRSNFGDDPTVLLPNGDVLGGYIDGPQTYLYNPTANSWSPGPTKLDGDKSVEETWIKLPVSSALPQGGILSYSILASLGNGTTMGQVLNIATNTWTETQNSTTDPPGPLSSNALIAELGGGVMLPNGMVFQLGATGNTALYDPATNLWSAGPQIRDVNNNLLGADDAPVSILPDGQVIFSADFGPTLGTFSAPTELFDYDYNTNTISQITNLPSTLASDLTFNGAYVDRTLVLPNGQMLFDAFDNLFLFTPSDSPQNAWRPAISSITNNGNGTYTLTGTQLSGISEGSSYGDDVNVSENYPIVQLTASNGAISYATTSNWSNVLVSPVGDTTPESVDFTLPAPLIGAKGAYQLSVSANGISSNPQTFYIGTPVTVAAHNASTTFSTNSQTLALTANVNEIGSAQQINEGKVTFTVKNSSGATIGSTTGNVKGGAVSANLSLPANEPAGNYTIAVSYSDTTGPFFDGGDSNGTLTIAPAQVSTTASALSASYSPNAQTLTLNANLADNSFSGDVIDEGKVSFTVMNGGTSLGTVTANVIPGASSGGTASANFTLAAGQAPGNYTIVVSYLDSAGNYVDSGDTNATLTVSPAQVATKAAGALAVYSTNSQTLALSASIADTSIPSDSVNEGVVTFTIENGSTPIAPPVVAPVIKDKASTTFTLPAAQAADNYTIAVSYSDSLGNFADGGDQSATLNLTPARVAVTAATPITTVYNSNTQTLTLTANVANNSFPSQAVNEGAVTFTVFNGGTPIAPSVQGLVAGGTASASFTLPAGLPLGSYTITVSYLDSAGNYVDTGDINGTLIVAPANVTTAALNASLFYSTQPQTVKLNAAVTNASKLSDIVNEGIVTFTIKQGSTIVGNVQGTVLGGRANAVFGWSAGRAAGNYTIAVSYSDSAGNFFDTGDTSGALTVAPANVITTANNPPSVVHSSNTQSITLTANVADNTFSSDIVNEGAVTFTIKDKSGATVGSPVAGSVSNGAASAVFTLPAGQAVGSYTIAVSYSDSANNFSDSLDNNGALIVAPANVTTTANSSSATYSPNGQTLTLRASVANTSVPSQPVGEGVVNFTVVSGTKVIGTPVQGAVSSGNASASFVLPAGQAPGAYTIVVQYSDSQGSFRDSGDKNAILTVSPANVTTAANSVSAFFSPNSQTLSLSANVADASNSNDTVGEGIVTFTIKTSNAIVGSTQGTVLGGKAVADFTLPAGQAVGSYILAVSYGDSAGNFIDSGDSNALLTVSPANVATTANNISTVYSPNLQTLALSATVADTSIPADKVNEGVVSFTIKNGSTTIGNVQAAVLGGKANANFTLPAGQAAGSYTLAVSYSDSSVNFSDNGDTNGTLTISPANVTATANIASAVYSTNTEIVKLSANVVDDSVPTDIVNEGIVTFTLTNGSTPVGTAQGTVAGGKANAALTLPAGLAPGNYSVTVSYSDSNNNFTSSGSGGGPSSALTIAPAGVATTAVPSSAAVYSQSAQTVTLNANVVDASVASDTINEGVVAFTILNGKTVIGSAQGTVLGGTASATFTLPAGLAAGSYTIAVTYSDSQGHFTDSGNTYAALTVSPANAATTANNARTTFSTTAQTVMLSAAVADPGPANNVVNEGRVTFTVLNGSTVVASALGAVNGGAANAALTLPGGLAAGNYTVAVSYSNPQGNFADDGDNYSTLTVAAAGTNAQLTQVTLAPTLLSLTATETLTAHVSSSTAVMQGTVTFFVSNHAITANVDGNGNATAVVTLPMLELLGPQDISVQYNDAANDLTASSNAQTAAWRIFNPIVPSTATFTATSQSVTADLFGLFITYTNGVLTEIDSGSIHVVFVYNAVGQLSQVTFDGRNLI